MKHVAIVLSMILTGCAASGGNTQRQAIAVTAPGVPFPLEVELRVVSKDGRSTFHHLLPDGTVEFAGGREAIVRAGTPYGTITPAQLQQVWDVIQRQKLMEGKGKMFAKAETVSYDVRLTAGDARTNYSAVDREVPGLEELDRLLFKMQSEARYKDIFTPADDKIRLRDQKPVTK